MEKVMVVGRGRIVFVGDPGLAQALVSKAKAPGVYRTVPVTDPAELSFERATDDAVLRGLVAQAKIHGTFSLNDVLSATGQQDNAERWNAYYDAVKEGVSNRKWDKVWWQTIKDRKDRAIKGITAEQ